jgi:CHAD domain-containing protein
VTRDDTPLQAACRIAQHHCTRLARHADALRGGSMDAEDVHDMRVATRRVRAVLSVFQEFLPAGPARALDRRLRAATRRLGRVRDLDVLIAGLAGGEGGPPMDAATVQHFTRAQERARRRLGRYLDGPKYADLHDHSRRLCDAAQAGLKDASGIVALQAPVLLFVALAEARSRPPGPRPTLDDLHGLRIRMKRLRYTIECFQEILGDPGAAFLAAVKDLQDVLGAVQDARVAADRVEEYLQTQEPEGAAAKALAAYVRRQRCEANAGARAFPARWRAFERSGLRERLAGAAAGL